MSAVHLIRQQLNSNGDFGGSSAVIRKTTPIYLAFLCMGFGDAVGPIVGPAKDQFQLSNFMAGLIPSAAFIMFGVLSVPMGLVQDRVGRKCTLLIGLAAALLGLVIPLAIGMDSYAMFLLTIVLLGAGAAILQVAGNPAMRDVSAPGAYARNLTLAQFVKAIGSLSGPMIIAVASRYAGGAWASWLFLIYSAVVLATILSASMLTLDPPPAKEQTASLKSCLALLANPFVLMMVLAIFLYVGAEVSISSGVPMFLNAEFGVDVGKVGVLGTGLFFLALILGRFGGSLVLNWMNPATFLGVTAALALAATLGLFIGGQWLAVACFFLIGLGFANIFPLVFSIAVDRMPHRANELSGLMVTAIAGGAVLPPLMGMVADRSSVQPGFVVPAIAIVYILFAAVVVNVTEEVRATAS